MAHPGTEYEEVDVVVVTGNETGDVATPSAPLSREGYIAIGVYLVLLGLVAQVGNVTVLVVIVTRRNAACKLQNILMMNMAFVDLLVTLTSYPMTAVSSFYGRWVFSDVTCEVSGFLVFLLTMVSMDTLTFIAVFRYILVCKPKFQRWLRMDSAWPVLATTWAHAAVWTALPLLGWNRYEQESFRTSCSLDWDSTDARDVGYVALTALTCYALPLAVIVFCYGSILARTGKLTFGATGEARLLKLEKLLWQHKVVTEMEVTKMCAVMVGCFLLCWTPYAAISFLPLLGVVPDPALSTLPTMFAKLSCALNPVIYAFMSAPFRRALRSLVPCGGPARRKGETFGAMEVLGSGSKTCDSHKQLSVRHYSGDMTNQGVYIGNVSVSLSVHTSVF